MMSQLIPISDMQKYSYVIELEISSHLQAGIQHHHHPLHHITPGREQETKPKAYSRSLPATNLERR